MPATAEPMLITQLRESLHFRGCGSQLKLCFKIGSEGVSQNVERELTAEGSRTGMPAQGLRISEGHLLRSGYKGSDLEIFSRLSRQVFC